MSKAVSGNVELELARSVACSRFGTNQAQILLYLEYSPKYVIRQGALLMDCYLITKYKKHTGKYVASFEAGVLTVVLSRAREIVKNCTTNQKVEVTIEEDRNHIPTLIRVAIRDQAGNMMTLFIAERSVAQESIIDKIRKAVGKKVDAKMLKDLILSAKS